jgi:PPOX class probable F420-dependent enzyme
LAEIPADLLDLVTSDVVGHVAFVAPDGSLRTVILWVDFDGDHVLTSSPVGSFKGRAWRRDPRAAVSVVDHNDPWRALSISGRVVDIVPDEGLAFINKLSQRYVGRTYSYAGSREIFTIEIERVRASRGRGGRRSV